MGIEIERKFLVLAGRWTPQAEGEPYCQGYITSSSKTVVRIRIAGSCAFLTVKSSLSQLKRLEYEYEIPVPDAQEMLETVCIRPAIQKRRHKVMHGGLVWEVDVFEAENKGLVVAEVELPSEQHPFTKPDWAGEEVTGDDRYLNMNLVSNPYRNWK